MSAGVLLAGASAALGLGVGFATGGGLWLEGGWRVVEIPAKALGRSFSYTLVGVKVLSAAWLGTTCRTSVLGAGGPSFRFGARRRERERDALQSTPCSSFTGSATGSGV